MPTRSRSASICARSGAARWCTATSTDRFPADSTVSSTRRAIALAEVRTFSSGTIRPSTMCSSGFTDSDVASKRGGRADAATAAQVFERVDVEVGSRGIDSRDCGVLHLARPNRPIGRHRRPRAPRSPTPSRPSVSRRPARRRSRNPGRPAPPTPTSRTAQPTDVPTRRCRPRSQRGLIGGGELGWRRTGRANVLLVLQGARRPRPA